MKKCILITSLTLACCFSLPPIVLAQEVSEQAAKATMALDVLKTSVDTLKTLAEQCAKKICQQEDIEAVLDQSFFAQTLIGMSDTPANRSEINAILLYLVTEAKPEQLEQLYRASLAYHQALGQFQSQVLGDQEAAIFQFMTNAQARAKVSSVKANMHTIQTIIETYAVDWGGNYSRDLQALYEEASKSTGYGSYWRDFTNPFTAKKGIGFRGSIMDFKDYYPAKEFAGMVLVEMTQHDPEGNPTSYKIYGCDDKGELIQDKGTVFFLTNS